MRLSPRFGKGPNPAGRFIARLIFSVFVLNLIVGVIVALSLIQSRSRHEERAATASRNIASGLEREISSTFEKIDPVLLSVADAVVRTRAVLNADSDALDRFIKRQSFRSVSA